MVELPDAGCLAGCDCLLAPADAPPAAPKPMGIAATIAAEEERERRLTAQSAAGGEAPPGAGDGEAGAAAAVSSEPLPPLVIPEEGLDPVDRWLLQTYATLQKRCRRQGLRAGTSYFEESWL